MTRDTLPPPPMLYTLEYTRQGRLQVAETLRTTAIRISDMRGAFSAKDVLFALQSQAVALERAGRTEEAAEVRRITEATIRQRLHYDGGAYAHSRRANRVWHRLEKRPGGVFAWRRLRRSPEGGIVCA